MIQLGIVDDNRTYRKSLANQINYQDNIKVVLQANSGQDFLEQMKELDINNHPDIVLMDIDMPIMNGINTVGTSKIIYPKIKYLMLTVFDDNDKIFNAIKVGANGYLLKDENTSNIIKFINEIYENDSVPMSNIIAKKTLQLLSTATIEKTNENHFQENLLSQREIEILNLMAEGKNYKDISEKLFISPNTVRKHTANIYQKLHTNSKVQAISIAKNNNLI
jgi:DNA-binding NarL/FixJ family response regulator